MLCKSTYDSAERRFSFIFTTELNNKKKEKDILRNIKTENKKMYQMRIENQSKSVKYIISLSLHF